MTERGTEEQYRAFTPRAGLVSTFRSSSVLQKALHLTRRTVHRSRCNSRILQMAAKRDVTGFRGTSALALSRFSHGRHPPHTSLVVLQQFTSRSKVTQTASMGPAKPTV